MECLKYGVSSLHKTQLRRKGDVLNFQVDPRTRLTISDVLDRLAAIGETRGFQMKAGLKLNYTQQAATQQPPIRPYAPNVSQASPQPPRRPPPPNPSASHLRQLPPNPTPSPSHQHYPLTSSQPSSGLLSSLKGGAGSLLKNLKVIIFITQ